MTLLLDVDEILADFIGGYLRVVYECTGRRYTHSDVTSWDLAAALKLTTEERMQVENAIRRPRFCAGLKVLPGAQEAVAKMRELGHKIVVVTAPLKKALFWHSERYEWLRKNFGFQEDDVCFFSQKHLIRGDVMVDDRPEHLFDFQGRGLLWDKPYNQAATRVRVHNWKEVLGVLEKG